MIRHIALTLLAGLIAAAPAFAQQKTSLDTWGGGVLVSVDAEAKTILVRQGELEQRYQLDADAELQDGKTTLGVADLDEGVGRYVTIRYEQDGDNRVANKVNVLNRRGSVSVASSGSGSSGKSSQP